MEQLLGLTAEGLVSRWVVGWFVFILRPTDGLEFRSLSGGVVHVDRVHTHYNDTSLYMSDICFLIDIHGQHGLSSGREASPTRLQHLHNRVTMRFNNRLMCLSIILCLSPNHLLEFISNFLRTNPSIASLATPSTNFFI